MVPYSLSKFIRFVNLIKSLLNFLMRLFLLTGQLSVRITAAFSLSLSSSNNLQSYVTWSTICSPLLHEHIGLSWILYLCRYDLIFPCRYHSCKVGGYIDFLL